jgi:membrane protein
MKPPVRLRAALMLAGLSPREVIIRTWKQLNEHELMTRAAAISFYAMLACVPFLALVLTVLVQFLPDLTQSTGQARGIGELSVAELRSTLSHVFPPEAYRLAADQIARLQAQLRERPPIGILAVSLVVTLWLASSVYTAVIDAMDRIYGVRETRSFVKIRITAIVMTVLQATILLVALIAIVAGPEILSWLHVRGHAALVATVVQWVVLVVLVLLSFAVTYYVAPDADQSWEWITPGSLFGTPVLLGFCLLFRLYVQRFANYDKTYGSLGGVMVLLFWFWVTSLVLLTGGQLNKIIEDASPLGKNFGQKTDPTVAPDFAAMDPEPARGAR